jgi:hypothetical protein
MRAGWWCFLNRKAGPLLCLAFLPLKSSLLVSISQLELCHEMELSGSLRAGHSDSDCVFNLVSPSLLSFLQLLIERVFHGFQLSLLAFFMDLDNNKCFLFSSILEF